MVKLNYFGIIRGIVRGWRETTMKHRNLWYLKTGHVPSDQYFKSVPVWKDTEMLCAITLVSIISFTAGFILGWCI